MSQIKWSAAQLRQHDEAIERLVAQAQERLAQRSLRRSLDRAWAVGAARAKEQS